VLLQVLEGAGRADESTGRGQRLRRHSQAAHDRQTAAGRRQEQEEVRPGSQACLQSLLHQFCCFYRGWKKLCFKEILTGFKGFFNVFEILCSVKRFYV